MDALITYIVIWIIAFMVGFVAAKLTKKKELPVGTLIIDHQSIPEDEPYLFLQTRVDPRALLDKKTVVFEVSTEPLIIFEILFNSNSFIACD